MKKLIVLVVMMFSLVFSASALGDLDIVGLTPASASGDPGQTLTFNLTVSNSVVNETIPTATITSTDLSFGEHKISAPTISSVTNLNNTEAKTVSFSVVIPNGQTAGTYTGTLTVQESGNETNKETIGYSVTVNSKAVIGASGTTVKTDLIEISVEPGDDNEITVTLTNVGNMLINNLLVNASSNLNLKDSDDNDIELTITPTTPLASLDVGQSTDITIKADVDRNFEIGKVTGDLEVSTTQGNFALPVEIDVKPNVCEFGDVGSLSVDIDEPGSNDDFDVGDTFDVEIKVENNHDNDLDIKVEAVLYDTDDNEKIDSYKSKTVDVDKKGEDDDEYTFKFSLTVDNDADSGNDFKIYVKAYEDDDEDKHCAMDDISVDVKRADDKLIVNSFTLNPISASCGSLVEGVLSLENIGSNDQDVTVTVKNSLLGLNQLVDSFTLKSDKDENDRISRFTFTVPNNAENKQYDIEVNADYSGLTAYGTASLQVFGCTVKEEVKTEDTTSTGGEQSTDLQGSAVSNATTTYTEKDLFDMFNTGADVVPSSVWLLVDVLLVVGIIALLVSLFRRPRVIIKKQ